LTAFAGTFTHGLYGDATVSVENGALSLDILGFKTPLEHWHFDSFRVDGSGPVAQMLGPLIAFGTNQSGVVHQLSITGGGGATFVPEGCVTLVCIGRCTADSSRSGASSWWQPPPPRSPPTRWLDSISSSTVAGLSIPLRV
jgi:hypothetical protein